MRSIDPTTAITEIMTRDSADRRFVLRETQKWVGRGWTVSSARMNIHSEVTVNLWRPLQEGETHERHDPFDKATGDPIKVEFLRFFGEN